MIAGRRVGQGRGVELIDWTVGATAPGAVEGPDHLDDAVIDWVPFTAPGTAASALAAAGRWTLDDGVDFDASDWWFRCRFAADGPTDGTVLRFGGLATVADVWLNGTHMLSSANMFRSHAVDVSAVLQVDNDLVVRCAALAPLLAARRPRPRWRTNIVTAQNLRWYRTTLHGRMTEWTGSCAPVGPWRPVTLGPEPVATVVERRVSVDGDTGQVELVVDLAAGSGEASVVVSGPDGSSEPVSAPLVPLPDPENGRRHRAVVEVPDVARWWPATHGDQPRYGVAVRVRGAGDEAEVELGRVGFRDIDFGEPDHPRLAVNGQPVFCRGVVWSPVDPVGLAPSPEALRDELTRLRDAGMNLVRVPATGVYESDEFLDLCDELGLLVWADLMFARMDYPADDPEAGPDLVAEVAEQVARWAGRPSVAVVAGGSEIGQQAAMLGRAVTDADLVGWAVAPTVAAGLPDVPYVLDAPSGGTHPFSADVGVANYFGVGGYRRPLGDARAAGVRFASESLCLSNIGGDDAVAELTEHGVGLGDPVWKRGIVRDRGAPWDFEDVRDHYVRELFGVDPTEIRLVDPDRYLDLGRIACATVMARTFAEWRRPASPCGGAVILTGRDVRPGAGPGIVDHAGRPKSPYFALRPVLAPVTLLLSDEGLNGLDIWALNDSGAPRSGTLTVTAYAERSVAAEGEIPLTVGPRSHALIHAEAVLGSFLDVTYAYRFGPTPLSAVAVHWRDGDRLLARAVHRPGGGLAERGDIGLDGVARPLDPGADPADGPQTYEITVTTGGFAQGVLVEAPGATMSDNAFDLEPGGSFTLTATTGRPLRARVRSLNSLSSTPIAVRHD